MGRLLKNILILATMLSCVSVFIIPESYLNNVEDVPVPVVPQKVSAAIPVQLFIESVGIHSYIESVGILGKAMAVPTNSVDVGWYDLGVRPGDPGVAVLAGHVNWYHGQDAAFTNLHLVAIGDTVEVVDKYGESIYFVVRDIKRYPFDADTSEVFSSNDDKSHLNLITCDGAWSVLMGTHESRLVVFTDKLEKAP